MPRRLAAVLRRLAAVLRRRAAVLRRLADRLGAWRATVGPMRIAVGMSVGLVAWSGVANLVLGDAGYVPRNLLLTAALLVAAARAGATPRELGLDRRDLGAGARLGALAVAVVAVVVAAGVVLEDAVPGVAALLADDRTPATAGGVAAAALVRIPLGTALFEEVAFRGVLLAALLRVTSVRMAVAASSVVFGLWHVAPTIVALRINGVDLASSGAVLTIVGSVLVTTVAGVLFCLLRLHSRSLLAPILAHWATNAIGLVAAAWTQVP